MNGARPREPVSTEELFRGHAPFVARFLTRLGVRPDELDDAVQEVFLVVHRNGGYMPGPATPAGYLASIALRAASSHRRRGRKSRERRADVAPDDVSALGPDPARALEVQQSLAELQGALDGLDPDLRATLVLAELEGESCLSIATTMQIAVGTVYWRLHRARKTFRQAIESRRVAERRAQGLAAGALLFGPPAEELLDAGRTHPGVRFDVSSALARLREALGSGTSGSSVPHWAMGATGAGLASGVGLTAPAVLSALVMVNALGSGVSRWDAAKAGARTSAPTTLVASMAPDIPRDSVVAASPAPPVDLAPPTDPARPANDLTPVGQRAAGQVHVSQRSPGGSVVALRPPPRLAADPPPAGDPPALTDAPAHADPPSPDAIREIQEVAAAQKLLTSDPAQALALVRSGEAQFPSGYLREERRYVGVAALFKLGRVDEARAEASRFLSDYPDGPFSARVRAAR
jgi:RNA polymerase sigma-70 factor (ECF subfamily)